MSKATQWRRRQVWNGRHEFHVPSADPGIPFRVTVRLEGTRSRRVPEESAATVAAGFVLLSVEQTVVRYDASCVDAAQVAANAACVPSNFHHPGVQIGCVKLTVEVEPWQHDEARRLAILRRTADIAGREAVARQADVDISTSTEYVAPDKRWLRLAEAMDRLVQNSDPETRKETIKSLADWATRHDRELAQALESVSDEEPSLTSQETVTPARWHVVGRGDYPPSTRQAIAHTFELDAGVA